MDNIRGQGNIPNRRELGSTPQKKAESTSDSGKNVDRVQIDGNSGRRIVGARLGRRFGLNPSLLSQNREVVHFAANTVADATWDREVTAAPVS